MQIDNTPEASEPGSLHIGEQGASTQVYSISTPARTPVVAVLLADRMLVGAQTSIGTQWMSTFTSQPFHILGQSAMYNTGCGDVGSTSTSLFESSIR